MSRTLVLAGWAAIATAAVVLEAVARVRHRASTLGDVLRAALGRPPVRAGVLVAWLWLGWHVFVRVDWR